MMKKLLIVLMALMLACLFSTSYVQAYPFIEVEGYVSPGSYVNNGDGTSTFSEISYLFTVTTADFGAEMDFLSLEFESDVFDSVGTLSGINPADWTTATLTSSSGSVYQIASAGTTLGAGQSLSFTMQDVVLFNDALSNPLLWQEGQFWAQSFVAGDTLGGSDGGSTAATPEPGTLLLLSSGFMGAGYFLRHKIRRGQKVE